MEDLLETLGNILKPQVKPTIQIEIINDDFEVINNNKSITISNENISDAFMKEYEYDVKNEIYSGEFKHWILDNDKCIEYIKSVLNL